MAAPAVLGQSVDTNSIPLKEWRAPEPTKEKVDYADIETIDLAFWDQPGGKEQLAKIIGTALNRDGFFYVVNHSFTPEITARMFNIAQVPFDHVPQEEKERYVADIKQGGTFKGYKLQKYWEIENGVRDRIEHYNLYNGQIGDPENHPTALRPFLGEIQSVFQTSRREIVRKLLALISTHLQLPNEDYLWNLHQNDETGEEGPDLFRFMMYEPLTVDESQKTSGVYLKGHTDFNTISLLFSQPITSLQILMPDGQWRYVKHRDNALVINIGDQLGFFSGGYLKPTIHRVIRPPPDQAHYRRLGVFHFAHFLPHVRLMPLFNESPVVKEFGKNPFPDYVPTSGEWERSRVSAYGTTQLVKGEKWDEETIAGIVVRHYN